jgi:hypothetical protein
MTPWLDDISHEIDVSEQLDADFNLVKIHFISQRVKQIRHNVALQDYSAESHEEAHNTNLKDSWNTSNHILNYLPEAIMSQRRILCFVVRELNIEVFAQHQENSAAASKVLPSSGD